MRSLYVAFALGRPARYNVVKSATQRAVFVRLAGVDTGYVLNAGTEGTEINGLRDQSGCVRKMFSLRFALLNVHDFLVILIIKDVGRGGGVMFIRRGNMFCPYRRNSLTRHRFFFFFLFNLYTR